MRSRYFAPTLLLLASAGCALPTEQHSSGATPVESSTVVSDRVAEGPVFEAAARYQSAAKWQGSAPVGNVVVDDQSSLYLFGSTEDMESALQRRTQVGWLQGVLLDANVKCVGTVDIPPETSWTEGPVLRLDDALQVGDREIPIDGCAVADPDEETLRRIASTLRSEDVMQPYGYEEQAPSKPLAACASACGSTQGYTYAGQTAYSNGSSTGSGNSCNGSDAYGYRYQCVQYTERVAQRTDWAGNAYPGYWSQTGLSSGSTSQGPYYKGLLPLGSGTSYAAPQAGDIVVWSGGTYGHVAVIASVGASSITVYDQNRHCGDQSCLLTYSTASGKHTLSNGSAAGYCGAEGLSSSYVPVGYLHRGWDFGGFYGLANSSSTGQSQHNFWLSDATYVGGTTSGSTTDISDYVQVNPGTVDPQIISPTGLKVPAYSGSATHGYRYFNVYIQSNCANKTAQLFWKRTTDADFSATRSVTATISGSGWQSLKFDPSVSSSWSGTIDQIRIDPALSCSSGSTDTIALQSAYFWR